MENAHNNINWFILTRSTENILGQKISYPTKVFDLRTTGRDHLIYIQGVTSLLNDICYISWSVT